LAEKSVAQLTSQAGEWCRSDCSHMVKAIKTITVTTSLANALSLTISAPAQLLEMFNATRMNGPFGATSTTPRPSIDRSNIADRSKMRRQQQPL
jgi:hypothetical protein